MGAAPSRTCLFARHASSPPHSPGSSAQTQTLGLMATRPQFTAQASGSDVSRMQQQGREAGERGGGIHLRAAGTGRARMRAGGAQHGSCSTPRASGAFARTPAKTHLLPTEASRGPGRGPAARPPTASRRWREEESRTAAFSSRGPAHATARSRETVRVPTALTSPVPGVLQPRGLAITR